MRRLRPILKTAAAIAAAAILALSTWTVYDLKKSRDNHKAHQSLALGMSTAQVRALMGRGPDCIVMVGRSAAWYYGDAFGVGPCPSSVAAPSDLPRAYDSLQVLLAPDGRVTAFALDGESGLTSAKGAARGQSLAELPATHIE